MTDTTPTTAPPTIILDRNDSGDIDPIPRNRYGAPRAPHPHTGKTVTWQRPSGLAKKFLSDSYHLEKWVQRTIAKGAGLAPDLGALAAHLDVTEDKTQLDDLAARMGQAGRIDAAGRPSRIGPGEGERGPRQRPAWARRPDRCHRTAGMTGHPARATGRMARPALRQSSRPGGRDHSVRSSESSRLQTICERGARNGSSSL